jgi:hypothetical protein
MLIGGPDSGKTNYLARLWEALRSGEGRLKVPAVPPNIKYVEDALAHLLQGSFAPRTDKNLEESRRSLVIPVESEDHTGNAEIVVPDVSGELWKSAVETSELPSEWLEQMKKSSGALLFVRVLSDLNVAPLDWVTAEKVLRLHGTDEEALDAIPTQVSLCELLRFLEISLRENEDSTKPRVAVLVTAWDRLDNSEAAAGPRAYIEKEYPLFAGRLRDIDKLDIDIFGVSVVGGDLDVDEEFRKRFFEAELKSAGYVVTYLAEKPTEVFDITLPVAWLVAASPKTL